MAQRFLGEPIVTQDALLKALREYADSQRRSQILEANKNDNMMVATPWDYQSLWNWFNNNEVTGAIGEALLREITRNRGVNQKMGAVQPRWLRKCPQCGTEFHSEKEECPECKVETLKPDINQKRLLEAFIEDPNPDDEMITIVSSAFMYMFSVDDWYLSMQPATNGAPFTVYIENSLYMRVCADKFGRIGNKELFCVEDREHPDRTIPKGQRCPEHPDAELKETAYVYKEDKIKARFGKDEVLHGKPHPRLPSLYGYSLLIQGLRTLMSVNAMDKFNYDNYNEGKLGNILVFEGMSQEEASNLAQEMDKQKNQPKLDINTGSWVIKKLRTLFLGSPKTVTNVPAMPESEKMQSLDWWKLWKSILCGLYGVQDISVGNIAEGTTGQNPRIKVDVGNNAIEYWESKFEDPFNNVVVMQGLGVTDWVWKFNPVEEKDEMQDVTILKTKLEVIAQAINLGMQAELTDEGEVKISGDPMTLEQKNQMRMDQMKQAQQLNPQGEGDKSFEAKTPFKKEEVFSAEKGKKWIVQEVKEKDAIQ